MGGSDGQNEMLRRGKDRRKVKRQAVARLWEVQKLRERHLDLGSGKSCGALGWSTSSGVGRVGAS